MANTLNLKSSITEEINYYVQAYLAYEQEFTDLANQHWSDYYDGEEEYNLLVNELESKLWSTRNFLNTLRKLQRLTINQ